jgi:hypothetical protein
LLNRPTKTIPLQAQPAPLTGSPPVGDDLRPRFTPATSGEIGAVPAVERGRDPRDRDGIDIRSAQPRSTRPSGTCLSAVNRAPRTTSSRHRCGTCSATVGLPRPDRRVLGRVLDHGWAARGYSAADLDPNTGGLSRLLGEDGVSSRSTEEDRALGLLVAALGARPVGLSPAPPHHLAAQVPGATVRDLMQRMGHDNERAAMIYLHATQGADQRIADALPVQFGEQN